MHDEKIGDFLGRLADRVPTPGGGAAAAMHAALGAALRGMVARYSNGEQYAEHQVTIGRITAGADDLRDIALRLAAAEAAAFRAVAYAHRPAKSPGAGRAARAPPDAPPASAVAPASAGPRRRARCVRRTCSIRP